MLPSNLIRQTRERRIHLLEGLVLVGFGVVSIGLLRLQVSNHEKYKDLSQHNYVRLEVRRAPRGTIYDRNGVLLADSAPSANVVFRPFPAESLHRERLTSDPAWIARVARLVEKDTLEIQRLVRWGNSRGRSVVLRRNAPFAIWAAIEEEHERYQGVEVQTEPLRHYPYGTLAAHLLGYAGEITDAELDSLKRDGYNSGDLIGRSGVERKFEKTLRGVDGAEFVVVNANGKRVSTLTEEPPVEPRSGHDMVLTLDLVVQQAMEEAMAGVDRGAAVALDPRDGGILGMVSRPAFDPNEFSVGLTSDRWRQLASGGSNPLLNRAIQGVYPPGSTFKIVTMLAAMQAGVARPETRFAPCAGRFFYGGRYFGCWKKSGHGSLDLVGALQHSCDVYFYQVGLKLGLPNLERTARSLGLGDRTGIDLPQEKRGLVPSPEWYDQRWGAGQWRKGVLLNLAIGQGELLLTPLQLALMIGEAAVDGQSLQPHVVREVRPAVSTPGSPARPRVAADPEMWAALHQAMELVVTSGTATMARVPGVRVGGKTGTAQNPLGDDHALFVCYAPIDSPRIVLAFVVENAGHGGSVAAPLAGKVLSRMFLPDSLQKKSPVHVTGVARSELSHAD